MDDDATELTGVVLPVPEADRVLRPRALASGEPWHPRSGVPLAHVTVLAPFVPAAGVDDGVLAELRDFFADVTDFPLTLEALCTFPDGLTYLAPEPADVLRRLTQGLHRRFPEFPPYGDRFDDVVPHLTVPLLPDEDVEALRTTLKDSLPIHSLATRACLLHVRDGEAAVLGEFPFGSTAA